jgi:type IV pilus assembly protein PilO
VANPVSTALAKLPWYGQIGVFVALSLVLSGAFYYYMETPAQEAMTARRAELVAVQGRVANGQNMARRLPEFRKEVADLEARLEVLKPILPTDRDAGDLLRRVQTMAVQSNLTILGFRPQAITLNEIHAEWPISLQLEGSYHNLGVFLDRVSKFPRIINIGAMNLAAKTPPSSAGSMNIGVTATTFVLVEPAADAPPVKGPSKGRSAKPAKK